MRGGKCSGELSGFKGSPASKGEVSSLGLGWSVVPASGGVGWGSPASGRGGGGSAASGGVGMGKLVSGLQGGGGEVRAYGVGLGMGEWGALSSSRERDLRPPMGRRRRRDEGRGEGGGGFSEKVYHCYGNYDVNCCYKKNTV